MSAARAIPFWWRALAWLALLALLPWWLGLPLLLAIVATLLVSAERLGAPPKTLRRSLRWGLPGMLFALQRALGGDALAWGIALLGALAGFTLLAGLEAWLDRGQHRLSVAKSSSTPEWRDLALAPIGPTAAIIELQPPQWLNVEADFADPRGGIVRWQPNASHGGCYRFADGTEIDAAAAYCSFSPDGRWFAAPLAHPRGVILLDREHARLHRLRDWELCGWHPMQPWLLRGEYGAPTGLKDVLGHSGATSAP